MTDVKFFVRHRTEMTADDGTGYVLTAGGYYFIERGLAEKLESLGAGAVIKEPIADTPKIQRAAELYRLKQAEEIIKALQRRGDRE